MDVTFAARSARTKAMMWTYKMCKSNLSCLIFRIRSQHLLHFKQKSLIICCISSSTIIFPLHRSWRLIRITQRLRRTFLTRREVHSERRSLVTNIESLVYTLAISCMYSVFLKLVLKSFITVAQQDSSFMLLRLQDRTFFPLSLAPHYYVLVQEIAWTRVHFPIYGRECVFKVLKIARAESESELRTSVHHAIDYSLNNAA